MQSLVCIHDGMRISYKDLEVFLFGTSILKIQTDQFSKIMSKSSNLNEKDNANGHLIFVHYTERKYVQLLEFTAP
jgi:hypothetical protein